MRNNTQFSRRLFLVIIIKFFLFFALLVRMFKLQIVDNFYFNQLSERNRTSLVPVIPKRGIIFDILNVEIANNSFFWEALVVKSEIKQNIELFLNNVSSLLYLTPEDKARIIKDYKNNSSFYPISIKEQLSDSEIAAIETFSYNIPGIFLRPFYRRNYPFKDALSQIIGYTALSDDIKKSYNIPNWYLGKSGVEVVMDSFLKGEAGFLKYEVNAYGKVVRKLEQLKSTPGSNIKLTIDSALQNHLYSFLKDYHSASAIVSNVQNGNILALCSYPSFDPNLFSHGISAENWKALSTNEKAPLTNKTIQGVYPPGSTIKGILLLKALSMGIVTPATTVFCSGSVKLGNHTFHCWKRGGHGSVNAENAIPESCDVYFYELARKMKISDMNAVAQDFGFGEKQMSFLPSESKGSKIPKEERTTLGDNFNSSIGQGKWQISPIQIHKMVTILATGGKDISFNLLRSIDYQNKIIYPKNKKEPTTLNNYPKEYFDIIRKNFFDTINTPKGTARSASTGLADWQVSGKTGTAQVRRFTAEERRANNGGVIANHLLPWNRRDHALFTGFLPFDNPKYAITIVVEHGGSGAGATAGIVKEIALFLKKQDEKYKEMGV
jgi:penicillin-binding protein 2